ncbi:hypothetical protein C7974DRAFT_414676 [Boeremia exigua]|uniref:uncharacterized protein n=1 Tax=Boeremia exigua TaxID=749465 RepID=UPI001E8E8DC9|nr:uncharacterized protein C7974DRAFT_414676 [Boeremia exigua]KAH6621999.1 hypothetical protein C7974DRAFT_414676 [Boeremia exigua]
MKLRNRPIEGNTFRFLDLPAELRNAIYEIISSSDTTSLTRRTSYGTRAVTRRDDAQDEVSCFQLIHVNQQVRQEFLPVYYGKLNPSIRFYDICDFANTFLIPYHAPFSAATVVVNTVGISEIDAREVDVRPLLEFLRRSPAVTFQTTPPPKSAAVVPNRTRLTEQAVPAAVSKLLMDLVTPPDRLAQKKWALYMQKYVTALFITPSRRPHVRVVVKHAATEFWMGHKKNMRERAMGAWVEKTGFPTGLKRHAPRKGSAGIGGVMTIWYEAHWTVVVEGS